MPKTLIAGVVTAASLLLTSPALSSTADVRLSASVSRTGVVSLKTVGGERLRTLAAGTYSVVVTDRSVRHNFRLKGATVNRATGLAFSGRTTWRVRLVAGDYFFRCDKHPRTRSFFMVAA